MLRPYYYKLITNEPGELYAQFFQAENDRAAVAAATCDAALDLPKGVHVLAVCGLRREGSSYVIQQVTLEVGGQQSCASA